MKKEEVYLDLIKLTSEELKRVAECVKDEMFEKTYKDLSKGINSTEKYLVWYSNEWARCSLVNSRKEITYDEFINNFGKPKDPVMVTLPIEDYNRLRKLEIKQEIKRLKKELKGL